MSAVIPCPLGGISRISWPAKLVAMGVTQFRLSSGEVVEGQETAAPAQFGDDVFRHLALVKDVAAPLGDRPKGAGQCGIAHDIAGLGRLAILQVVLLRPRIGAQFLNFRLPIRCNPGRHRHAVFGKANGRTKRLAERHRAMLGKQAIPGVDGARHRDRMHAVGLDLR